MWTRAELKERAKIAIKRNYVPCILISLVLLFAMGSQQSATVAVGSSENSRLDMQIYNSMYQTMQTYLLGPTQVVWNNIEIALGGLAGIICLLLKIFVFNPKKLEDAASLWRTLWIPRHLEKYLRYLKANIIEM